MNKRNWWAALRLFGVVFLLTGLVGCNSSPPPKEAATSDQTATAEAGALTIVSGSENQALEPLVQEFAQQNNARITMTYEGSVSMMENLRDGNVSADAVWPASSFWIDLGDRQKKVRYRQSIYRTPVVFGVKRAVAARLGWIDKPVTVDAILKAAESGRLRFMMTSATQSNSGASAYLGYLYAFANQPDILTAQHLQAPAVRNKIKRILGTVNRSSGSSGWLKDLFLEKYSFYDAMVNYEALIIETNQALVLRGQEPLHVIYPQDGLAVADSPLGYVDKGDAAKEVLFQKLQKYLLSPAVQEKIRATGRRTGTVGLVMTNSAPAVFKPEWGINTGRTLVPIRLPEPAVVQQALELYQTAFRKPSLTVFCLDVSGSMEGDGIEQLKSAMRMLLDPATAKANLLQASPGDVTAVMPFNEKPLPPWIVKGNQAAQLETLGAKVNTLVSGGGTNIYTPTAQALNLIRKQTGWENFSVAIVLMTDGQSNQGSLEEVKQALQTAKGKVEVPVYAVLFGAADEKQLREVAALSSGKIFDGRRDLVKTFREVKGYN